MSSFTLSESNLYLQMNLPIKNIKLLYLKKQSESQEWFICSVVAGRCHFSLITVFDRYDTRCSSGFAAGTQTRSSTVPIMYKSLRLSYLNYSIPLASSKIADLSHTPHFHLKCPVSQTVYLDSQFSWILFLFPWQRSWKCTEDFVEVFVR